MSKKIFLSIATIFTLIVFSSTTFAVSDTLRNGMDNAGTEMKDSWNKMGNTMQDIGNAVTDGVSNVGNMLTNNDNNVGFMGTNNDNNGEYTATRTSTNTDTFMGMNGTVWTWLIFGILAVAVVALVWYYGMQNDKAHTGRHE